MTERDTRITTEIPISVCDILNAAPETQAEPQPQPASEARIRANVANSKHSTGPRSTAGRQRAALNGVRHGQCSRTLFFLEGENPEDYYEELKNWQIALAPANAVENALLVVALNAWWAMRRCDAAQAAAATLKILGIKECQADRQAAEVRALVPGLSSDPAAVVARLRQSPTGCLYILDQYKLISEWLVLYATPTHAQRWRAVELSGRKPSEIFTDREVRGWAQAYLTAQCGTRPVTPEMAACMLQAPDRPEGLSEAQFKYMLAPLVEHVPDNRAGFEAMKARVDAAIAELTERVDLLKAREERDQKLQVQEAGVDTSAEGMNRLRYYAQHDRTMRAALRELRALQESRRQNGEEGDDLDEDIDKCTHEEDPPPGEIRNEAKAPAAAGTAEPLRVADPQPAPAGLVVVDGVAGAREVAPEEGRVTDGH